MATAIQPDMRDTMFRVEAALARVVAASGTSTRGLRIEARPAVQGPFTLSYPVYLGAYRMARDAAPMITPATADDLRRFMALGPAFTEAVRHAGVPIRGSVRVAEVDGHGLVIEVPSPAPWLPSGNDLAAHTAGLRVCVGLDQWRRPAFVDFHAHHGLLFVGATGSGKTLSALSCLYGLARANRPSDLAFIVLGRKVKTWAPIARADHCLGLASTPAEMRQAATWAVAKMRRRNRDDHKLPALVVVVDDAHEVFEDDPALGRVLAPLWTAGRECHVIPWYTTQTAGSSRATGDSISEDNMRARIQFKTVSATASAKAAGQGGTGLHLLSGQTGDAALNVDNHIKRIATAWLTDTSDLAGEGLDAPVWASQPLTTVATGRLWGSDTAVEGGFDPRTTATVAPVVRLQRRPPTPDEMPVIVANFHACGGSKSRTCRETWGAKDGLTWAWLHQALGASA